MRSLVLCLVISWTAFAGGPVYTAESVVNSASGLGAALAPNTLCTIYGKNLSWTTRQVQQSDIAGGQLPTVLTGTGVRVFVRNIAAYILYVSPTQINFLISSQLMPGPADLWVALDGQAGPTVTVNLAEAAPALFLWAESSSKPLAAIAERLLFEKETNGYKWALATHDSPARPGETIVLYATGLGQTDPPVDEGRLPTMAAEVLERYLFDITLDGTKVERENIQYAGVAPTFGGLYQINLKLPDWAPENPEIRIVMKSGESPAGVRVAAGAAAPAH